MIEENGYASQAELLKERLSVFCPNAEFSDKKDGKSLTFAFCQFLFTQEDLSFQKYYIDSRGNVLADEQDALMIINYPFSKRAFIYSLLPLFRRSVEQLRKSGR